MAAYYNEHDPYAAQWLRNLITAGHIAPGDVDERSIEDVRPSDLAGYTQCHFFAGIGVWSLALRRAIWADDRPVWTGSCPCQPFSAAGKGLAFDDERHLWPAFSHLVKERRPVVVFGEQVASKDANTWLDLVQDDLEGMGYAVGAVPFPAAGVGAPNIRDRLYWVADAGFGRDRPQAATSHHGQPQADRPANRAGRRGVLAGGMANTNGRHPGAERQQPGWEQRQQPENGGTLRLGNANGESAVRNAGGACCTQTQIDGANACDSHRLGNAGDDVLRLADTAASGRREECQDSGRRGVGDSEEGFSAGFVHGSADSRPGPTNGYWRDADWIGCTDGKWRPVEPGTFPLAHGATARMGRLRAYGNAINAAAAEEFIRAHLGA